MNEVFGKAKKKKTHFTRRLDSPSFFSFTSRVLCVGFFWTLGKPVLLLVILMTMRVLSKLLVSLLKLAPGPYPGTSNSTVKMGWLWMAARVKTMAWNQSLQGWGLESASKELLVSEWPSPSVPGEDSHPFSGGCAVPLGGQHHILQLPLPLEGHSLISYTHPARVTSSCFISTFPICTVSVGLCLRQDRETYNMTS